MFTGIIEELGTVREAQPGRLIINAKKVLWGTNLGDSIAVNGVDLTCTYLEEDGFHASVMAETYRRSNLGELKPGDEVNLERALTLAQRLGGHLVRGVVEATGTLESLTPEGESIIARYKAPPEILRYVVVKGPVAIDGASLTVIDKTAHTFAVSLVEYTQQHTNLTRRKPGDRINLESDIIARYVGQLLDERAGAK
ncbi:MAG: riboflavin synthase [Dehalococcoidia bacterium]|nr:riboflavin synthase [Dehalococcoidia bacterium]MDZ4277572.1 riboflavin synthase [Dehalococcoidia bacterium]